MKVAGIIVEYNPFHNGHKFHIEQTKKLTGADYIIAIMSGNYVQRGEPAIINKFIRTEMALENGIDLCIELPTCYATASAEYFAYGAVSILHKLNIVDYICFGSEVGDIKELECIANVLNSNDKFYTTKLNNYLKQGNSYPKSRELALIDYFKSSQNYNLKNLKDIITSPNNILGIEYIKALKKLDSSITPITVKRSDNGYNETNLNSISTYSSASSIRTNIKNLSNIKKYVPTNVYNKLKKEYNKCYPLAYNDFSSIASHILLNNTSKDLSKYVDVEETIANKLLNASLDNHNITDILEHSKSKDVTHTRLSRALMHIILGESKHDFKTYIDNGPLYARILGFKRESSSLLKLLKKQSDIPLINKLSLGDKSLSPSGKKMLDHDIKCATLYNKITCTKFGTTYSNEYKTGVKII